MSLQKKKNLILVDFDFAPFSIDSRYLRGMHSFLAGNISDG